jgi:hypothetical protein
MAPTGPGGAALSARIVYWGAQGSGKTTNLRVIHSKLRPDHRGELKRVAAPLDPTASSEVMPIELGDVGGVRTRLEVVAVPGGPEHAPTRKQLLDRVDGVVFVVDAQRDRLDENLASFDELRSSLAAYGRSLADLPLVVQYNKRDLADPYALEELHRKLDLRGAAAFEAVASDGTGVLPTLTTISKGVVRVLRERNAAAAAVPAPAPPPAPVPAPAAAPGIAPGPVAPRTALRAEPGAPPLRPAASAFVPAHPDLELETEAEAEVEVEADVGAEVEVEAAAATAARAEAIFEPGFARVRSVPPAPIPTPPVAAAPWSVASVGQPTVTDGGALRVPVVLRDGEGRTLSLALTVRIDAAPDADRETGD